MELERERSGMAENYKNYKILTFIMMIETLS